MYVNDIHTNSYVHACIDIVVVAVVFVVAVVAKRHFTIQLLWFSCSPLLFLSLSRASSLNSHTKGDWNQKWSRIWNENMCESNSTHVCGRSTQSCTFMHHQNDMVLVSSICGEGERQENGRGVKREAI